MQADAFPRDHLPVARLVREPGQAEHGHVRGDGLDGGVCAPVGDECVRHLEHLQLGAAPAHDEVFGNVEAFQGLWIFRDRGHHHHVVAPPLESLENSAPERAAEIPPAALRPHHLAFGSTVVPEQAGGHCTEGDVDDLLALGLVRSNLPMGEWGIDGLPLARLADVLRRHAPLILAQQHRAHVTGWRRKKISDRDRSNFDRFHSFIKCHWWSFPLIFWPFHGRCD
mmetsp:Transcript_628/g.1297  ORF Transcript_628/g.1297 Transcript_628/m.1297 type:complete len:225 (-) Transcript_628:1043-1717(-)